MESGSGTPLKVFIGYDPREHEAWNVAKFSLLRSSSIPLDVRPIRERTLRAAGTYTRPGEMRGAQRWDIISDAPCATEFSIARFFVPQMASNGWAVFVDCDFLFRADIAELVAALDPAKALMCVKHQHRPQLARKMDNQIQTAYSRKNWSSLFAINLDHPSNARCTNWLTNNLPGWALHNFCWLADTEIGALDPAWNWIEGVSDDSIDPKAVHYSERAPWFGHDCKFGEEWARERDAMKVAA